MFSRILGAPLLSKQIPMDSFFLFFKWLTGQILPELEKGQLTGVPWVKPNIIETCDILSSLFYRKWFTKLLEKAVSLVTKVKLWQSFWYPPPQDTCIFLCTLTCFSMHANMSSIPLWINPVKTLCFFQILWTMNLQMFKLVLEKAEEPEIK